MIAALFVVTDGPYFGRRDVDPWDVTRDAKLYAGPHRVIAHPPCERWGRYWGGGPSAKVKRKLGDDGGCFASALASVRRWGGVLEHPEASHAFAKFDLGRPVWRAGWVPSADGLGKICCVAQGNYGHRSRKLTWLYTTAKHPPELDWSIPTGLARLDAGYHSGAERLGGAQLGSGEALLTHAERLATPAPFLKVLLAIAKAR
jgi:hypothetical protein